MYTGEFVPHLRRDHHDRLRRAHHDRAHHARGRRRRRGATVHDHDPRPGEWS